MESGGEKKMVCVRKSVMIDFKCGARGIGVGVAPCEICVRRPGAPEFCKLRLGPDICQSTGAEVPEVCGARDGA